MKTVIRNLTCKQVADLLDCSEKHVRRLYDDGSLAGCDMARAPAPGKRRKRMLRFSEEDVINYQNGNTPAQTPSPPRPTRKPRASRALPTFDIASNSFR